MALADRILLIEDGCVARGLDVRLARSRAFGSADFGSLEQKVLERVLDIHHKMNTIQENGPA